MRQRPNKSINQLLIDHVATIIREDRIALLDKLITAFEAIDSETLDRQQVIDALTAYKEKM